jgi:hypothetical protein
VGEYFKTVLPRDGDQCDTGRIAGTTASAVGADTATMMVTMIAAFCTISIDTRLLSSTKPFSPVIRWRAKAPAGLSSGSWLSA